MCIQIPLKYINTFKKQKQNPFPKPDCLVSGGLKALFPEMQLLKIIYIYDAVIKVSGLWKAKKVWNPPFFFKEVYLLRMN